MKGKYTILVAVLLMCLLIVAAFAVPAGPTLDVHTPAPGGVLIEFEQLVAPMPGADLSRGMVFASVDSNPNQLNSAEMVAVSPALRHDLNFEVLKTKGGQLFNSINSVNTNPAYRGSFWRAISKTI